MWPPGMEVQRDGGAGRQPRDVELGLVERRDEVVLAAEEQDLQLTGRG